MEVDTVINHGLNGVFVLVDLWVTAIPIRILHFYIPTLFGVAYILFSVMYDFSGGSNALGSPYIYSVSLLTTLPKHSGRNLKQKNILVLLVCHIDLVLLQISYRA